MMDRVRLHEYLRRIGVDSQSGADIETLRRVHIGHREAFLFENLSIQSGNAVSVAVEAIERKFLDEGRGGYCFEHNTLFAAALRDLGFRPAVLLGRVRRGPPDRWCRTHMVLRVPIGSGSWLADCGFGGLGLLEPMPLADGTVSHQVGFTYRLRREGSSWILSCKGSEVGAQAESDAGSELDLYEFTEDPQTPGDIEVANHYTSTHRDSIFRRSITIQRTTRGERAIWRNDVLTRYRNGRVEEQSVGRGERSTIAREIFGVELPGGPFVYETESRD
jgi:N-hydroxyarylamine O-acetyltransferase